MDFPKFRNNSNQTSTHSAGDKQSLKTRMADKIGDMKAKIELSASKDMLFVARDSQEKFGGALNAQKSEKGKQGAGTYKYKTDALIKMLDGLVAKFDPALAKNGADSVKQRTTNIMYRIRQSGLDASDFQQGLAQGVRTVMAGYEMDPLFGSSKRDPVFQNKELKVIEEVLSTLVSRMSASDGDKYGLKKNRPTARDGSDRSAKSPSDAQGFASSRDTQEIENARQSRVYHAKVGNAVKNAGGALKETGRKTGAALRTYTEPVRRDVAMGGLQTAKGATDAAEAMAEAAKDLGHVIDHAQAHLVGGAIGVVAGTGQAAGKATVGLGKGTWNAVKKLGTGAKKAALHGVAAGKDKHAAQVDKARARKASTKGEAPKPAQNRGATAATSQPASSPEPRQRANSPASTPAPAAAQRPTLTRSKSTASTRSTSSVSSTGSNLSSNTFYSTSDEEEKS